MNRLASQISLARLSLKGLRNDNIENQKMKNQIEIYDIQKSKKGYEVEYSTELGADVTLDIAEQTLLDYIIDNELNVMEYFNNTKTDVDHETVDATTLLSEWYYLIITQYLNDLHK